MPYDDEQGGTHNSGYGSASPGGPSGSTGGPKTSGTGPGGPTSGTGPGPSVGGTGPGPSTSGSSIGGSSSFSGSSGNDRLGSYSGSNGLGGSIGDRLGADDGPQSMGGGASPVGPQGQTKVSSSGSTSPSSSAQKSAERIGSVLNAFGGVQPGMSSPAIPGAQRTMMSPQGLNNLQQLNKVDRANVDMIGAARSYVGRSANSLGPKTYGGGFGTPGQGLYGPSYDFNFGEKRLMGRTMVAESSPIRNPDGTINLDALQGVGDVIMNRVESPNYPNTVSGVILNNPREFSVINSGKMKAVKSGTPDYRSAMGLAGAIASGELPSAVGEVH